MKPWKSNPWTSGIQMDLDPLEVKSLHISCKELVTQKAEAKSVQTSDHHTSQGRALTIQI